MDHLSALNLRLSNERMRLAKAKTKAECELRAVWIAQIEKEIATERKFIAGDNTMTDDELLEALTTETKK